MTLKKKLLALLLSMLLLVSITACQSAEEPTPAEEPAGTSTDETTESEEAYSGEPLQIYASYGGLDLIQEAFTESTGIPVDMLSMSSGEVLSRMRAESGRALGDVWFGGGPDSFMVAAEEGLLHPYVSPEADVVDDLFKDPDGYWTGVSVTLVTLVVNMDLAESGGFEVPASWEDLLNPSYKGEVMMANPGISGSTYTVVSAILQNLGEEEGWAYLDALNENIPYYAERGSEPTDKVSLGEALIGIGPNGVYYENEGYPTTAIYPEDGTVWQHAPVAIIEGTDKLDAAQVFVDWTLSVEGQEVLAQGSPRPGIRSGVTLQPGVPDVDDLNLFDYDFVAAARDRDAIIEEWNERYGY